MYFSIFSSSEYYSDEDRDCNIVPCIDKDDICLICWLPGDNQNQINILTNFSNIKPKIFPSFVINPIFCKRL